MYYDAKSYKNSESRQLRSGKKKRARSRARVLSSLVVFFLVVNSRTCFPWASWRFSLFLIRVYLRLSAAQLSCFSWRPGGSILYCFYRRESASIGG